MLEKDKLDKVYNTKAKAFALGTIAGLEMRIKKGDTTMDIKHALMLVKIIEELIE